MSDQEPVDMGYVLFLDDVLDPYMTDFIDPVDTPRLRVARNYDEFVATIKRHGIPRKVYFDYQLGGEKTGLDCAKFLVRYLIDNGIDHLPIWVVHDKDESGWRKIMEHLYLGMPGYREGEMA